MKLRIGPEAEDETRAAALWYEQQRSGLGVEFLTAVDVAIQRIRQAPLRFAHVESLPEEHNVRRVLVDRFPFMLVYVVQGDEIRIVAVAHTSRRPGYWRNRR